MKKDIKVVIIVLIIMVIAIGGGIFWSENADKVPGNPVGTVGNTAGNLNNKGLFAEHDGKVYFSNTFDRGYLYQMNPDETDIKLVHEAPSKNIMAAGNFLYFYSDTSGATGKGLGYVVRNAGIFRMKKNGKNIKCLDRTQAINMQLVGNSIYYQKYDNTNFTQFYKVGINDKEIVKLSDSIINPVAANDGVIYYNGTEKDHYLYAYDTRSDVSYTVYMGNLWFPVYANGYVYYMDVSSDYRLCRYNLATQQVEILTNDRVDCYNVGAYNIYYQKNDADSPCLMRMNLDGSSPEIVAYGNYTDINLTSEYAYFKIFGDDTVLYHTPVIGPANVELFTGALNVISIDK